ncbi:MAG: NYN domain-containing protein, partial [Hyphomicrobiaceae bacterium]
MKREAGGPCLSAVFVDYDNIYLSLKRKSEEAAKRFAKDSARWLREIENGKLITATNAAFDATPRRIVMNRCYGNPVPRRNAHDNSTDMSSFPFVRHHFLRAGFEVIDCPPLTAQLKNSADIRMVMDIRDLLMHETYFDEFIILSGDADFTPVLIRLRAHARRTMVFANDFTAAPYTAICDGEVRESALIDLLVSGEPTDGPREEAGAAKPAQSRIEEARREILSEVVAAVRASATPVPLEALADRALRALGHERTIATGWAGA